MSMEPEPAKFVSTSAMEDTTEKEYYESFDNVKKFADKTGKAFKYADIKVGPVALLQVNWVVFLLATIIMWTFVIASAASPCEMKALFAFGGWMTWISQNFTWFYIGTNDAWFAFIIWLYLSKYSKLKLGKENEEPEFAYFSYFCMQFTCGVAIGMFTLGTYEPMYYYRGWTPQRYGWWTPLYKIPMMNDDDRAQQAMLITFFHWGAHAYVVYTLAAIAMALASYRKGLPMTFKTAFYPLLGDYVNSFLGDILDALAIAATTFGVCTSLGLGVIGIEEWLARMSYAMKEGDDDFVKGSATQSWIIVVLTLIATISVVLGVKAGLRVMSNVAFMFGLFYMLTVLLCDNTFFLMNNYVQSVGNYLQWILQLGFDCDTWGQLKWELNSGGYKHFPSMAGGRKNLVWGNDGFTGQAYGQILSDNKYWQSWKEDDFSDSWNSPGWHKGEASVDTYTLQTGNGEGEWTETKMLTCGGEWIASLTSLPDVGPHQFMDYWTIFYWGWWISWCPFVGMFIAKISRGRTIAQVIEATFFVTLSYILLWMAICGGSGIRLERFAESALGMTVDFKTGSFTSDLKCGDHYYDGSNNVTDEWKDPGTACYSKTKLVPLIPSGIAWGDDKQTLGMNCDILNMTGVNMLYIRPNVTDPKVHEYEVDTGSVDKVDGKKKSLKEYLDMKIPTGVHITSYGVWEKKENWDGKLPYRPSANKTKCDQDGKKSGLCKGDPKSKQAKELMENWGVTALACRTNEGMAMDVLYSYFPEGSLRNFVIFMYGIGLSIYFITSSDSGSWTDDTNSAGGMLDPPKFQKVYWCWTEGAVAIVLLVSAEGGDAGLKAVRGVSVVAGFPWTMALCFMCTAVYRGVKQEFGELPNLFSPDINFKTSLLDIFEGFAPPGQKDLNLSKGTRVISLLIAYFFPALPIFQVVCHLDGGDKKRAGVLAAIVFMLELVWIALMGASDSMMVMSNMAWIIGYTPIILICWMIRIEMRTKYNVLGSYPEDFFACLVIPQFVLSQLELEVKLSGTGSGPTPIAVTSTGGDPEKADI